MSAVFPFPPQPVTARRQLRQAVVATLERAALTVGASSVTVDSPGDWPYPQENLPAVCVRAPSDSKTSLTKGNTNFTTTVEVDVRAAVMATTAEAAQDAIEGLWFQIERAILLDYYVLQLVQNVPTVESTFEIKADGQAQLAGAIGRFRFETFEVFDAAMPVGSIAAPSIAPALERLKIVTVGITRGGNKAMPGDVGIEITMIDSSNATQTADTTDLVTNSVDESP